MRLERIEEKKQQLKKLDEGKKKISDEIDDLENRKNQAQKSISEFEDIEQKYELLKLEVDELKRHEEIDVGTEITYKLRELEKVNITASKQVCPKPVSAEVWRYADVRERWDSLVLRSWVGESSREQLYQEGRMSAVLRPEDLLAILRRRLGKLVDEAVIFTGTIPLIGGLFVPRPYFEAELFDESTGHSLRCVYRTRRVDPDPKFFS